MKWKTMMLLLLQLYHPNPELDPHCAAYHLPRPDKLALPQLPNFTPLFNHGFCFPSPSTIIWTHPMGTTVADIAVAYLCHRRKERWTVRSLVGMNSVGQYSTIASSARKVDHETSGQPWHGVHDSLTQPRNQPIPFVPDVGTGGEQEKTHHYISYNCKGSISNLGNQTIPN
ncbi:unnamed protein product [Linum trigynum]|uniref:Uncharacterized protein n=1 Tax=Linum trigynum TaxID=586398 RepID=A0AAV2F0K7_9ROSI